MRVSHWLPVQVLSLEHFWEATAQVDRARKIGSLHTPPPFLRKSILSKAHKVLELLLNSRYQFCIVARNVNRR